MSTWDIAGTVTDIIAAVSAVVAAIFTYSTVKTATETNKIAAEQSELNREYQEKSLRPSLDIGKTLFDVDLEGNFLNDWSNETERYKPRYASNYVLKVENLGNIPARKIEYSIGIENIEEIKDFIEQNLDGIERRVSGNIKFTELEPSSGIYNVSFRKQLPNSFKAPAFKATFYVEELGYLKSYHSSGEEEREQIYVPKLFVIFTNLLRDQITTGELVPKLIIKFKYFDPYSTCYYQTFILKPFIRNINPLNFGQFNGYFEIEEILNEKCDK